MSDSCLWYRQHFGELPQKQHRFWGHSKAMVVLYISGGVGVVDGTMTVVHAGNCKYNRKKTSLQLLYYRDLCNVQILLIHIDVHPRRRYGHVKSSYTLSRFVQAALSDFMFHEAEFQLITNFFIYYHPKS